MRRLDGALAAPSADRDATRQFVFVVEGRDGTHERLLALAPEIAGLTLAYSPEPTGLGRSFTRGFALVAPGVEFVVTLDGDLNHQPEEIPRLLARAQASGADLVIGSRDVEHSAVFGTPVWKRALSRLGNRALQLASGTRTSDKSSGFRVYRRAALDRLAIRRDGFSFLADLALQAECVGMTVVEEPITFVHRRRGRSKLPFLRTGFEYLALIARALVRRSG